MDRHENENFIKDFFAATASVESPDNFLLWAAYHTVAATLRNNVYIPFSSRRTKLFPNIYVMLLAPSGEARKSGPVNITESLLRSVGITKLIVGRSSIQGILSELSLVQRNSTTNQMLKGAIGTIISGEFAASLVNDPSTNPILTDLYDYAAKKTIRLRDSTVELEDVVLSLFVASNPALLQKMFTEVDRKSGLVGRMVIISANKARHRDLGLHENSEEIDNLYAKLIKHLKKISGIKRELSFTPEAKDYLNEWYKQLPTLITTGSETGFESRLHTLVMKLAILIQFTSYSEEDLQGPIKLDYVLQAIKEIRPILPNYHAIQNSIMGANNPAAIQREVLRLLVQHYESNPTMDEKTLLGYMVGLCDNRVWQSAIDMLKKADLISEIISGRTMLYGLTKKALNIFKVKA